MSVFWFYTVFNSTLNLSYETADDQSMPAGMTVKRTFMSESPSNPKGCIWGIYMGYIQCKRMENQYGKTSHQIRFTYCRRCQL